MRYSHHPVDSAYEALDRSRLLEKEVYQLEQWTKVNTRAMQKISKQVKSV